MPTHFDSFYKTEKVLSPKNKAQLGARGITKAVDGYIEDSSCDLKDAATFTFNRNSKAAKKVFAGIPQPHLKQKLKDPISPPSTNTRTRQRTHFSGTTVRSKAHAVVHDHMDPQQLMRAKGHNTDYVHSRGAATKGYTRQRTTYKVDDHMDSATIADTQAHGYNYVDMNSTIPTNDTSPKGGSNELQQYSSTGTSNSWRTSNPVPGMGEFRTMMATDLEKADLLENIEKSVRNVSRINYTQFAPELIPTPPPKKEKRSHGSASGSTSSRGGKVKHRSKTMKTSKRNTRETMKRRVRKREKQEKALKRKAEKSAHEAVQLRLAKVEKMQQKKARMKRIKDEKEFKRLNPGVLRMQAQYRGKRDRRFVEVRKDQVKASKKIQSLQRGRKARARAARLKKEKAREQREQIEASRKIQAIHRGKKDRGKVKRMKEHREQDAATRKIQAIRRGKKDREKVKVMKNRKREEDRIKEYLKAKEDKEKEAATRKIQSIQRGRKSRRKVQNKKDTLKLRKNLSTMSPRELKKIRTNSSIKIQSTYRMHLEQSEYQEDLKDIRKMQATIRGGIIRRRKRSGTLVPPRNEPSDDDEDSDDYDPDALFAEFASSSEEDEDEDDDGDRGGESNFVELANGERIPATEWMERERATKKIQAITRGRNQRRRTKAKKEKETATKKIQAIHRGRTQRKRTKDRRERDERERATKKIQAIHRGRTQRKKTRSRVKEKNKNKDKSTRAEGGVILVAMENFEQEEEDDLGFVEGDLLIGLKLKGEWWTGKHKGKQNTRVAHFPANHVIEKGKEHLYVPVEDATSDEDDYEDEDEDDYEDEDDDEDYEE